MSGIKVSLSLSAAANKVKGKGKAATDPPRKLAAFGATDDGEDRTDNDNDNTFTLASGSKPFNVGSKGKSGGAAALLKPPAATTGLSRQQRQRAEEAQSLDASVFEYDEVYDDMKAAEREAKAVKEKMGSERKPQYISGLMASAKQREIDRTRAEDKMVQRERLTEGSEFVDKDAFVTPAYLAQQEEHRKAEEEERKKKEQGPTAGGMVDFYKNLLEAEGRKHEAAMGLAVARSEAKKTKATVSGTRRDSLGLSATLEAEARAPQPELQYDPEPEMVPSEERVAKAAEQKTGQKVDLDDEGRIVDHRQLLTGGLNIGLTKLGPKKPSSMRGFAIPIAQRKKEDVEKQLTLAREEREKVGEDGLSQAERIRLSRERQSKMLEQQLMELEVRKRKQEEEGHGREVKKIARRNDNSKIEEMKQRAAERKKLREAVAAQLQDPSGGKACLGSV